MRTQVLALAVWLGGTACVTAPPHESSSHPNGASPGASEGAGVTEVFVPSASASTSIPDVRTETTVTLAAPPGDPLPDTCDPLPPPSRKPNAELVSHGRWFVTNATKAPLDLTMDPAVPLVVSHVDPGMTVAIASVSEGSGGHVRPSNFITFFAVESGGKKVYTGVHDVDWKDAGSLCGHRRFVLVVR